MIRLDNVTKKYVTRSGVYTVLNKINLEINRGEKIGILGINGAGKSTLIRILSGAIRPNEGRIHKTMSISWPLAFHGGFQSILSGLDNIKFLCRIYNAPIKEVVEFVQDFAQLGSFIHEPLKKYSSGMRARLAFAASIAINFDCFLIDEVIAVGDSRFKERCEHEIFVNRAHYSMVLVSHQEELIQEHCHKVYVLDKGILHDFETLDLAFDFYKCILQ